MAAPRLNDSQKEELVVRYREGETAQTLAAAYGCSPNTVSRVLKAALSPEEMAAIKKQARQRIDAGSPSPMADPAPPEDVDPVGISQVAEASEVSELAIDDADDFADDALDEADLGADDEGDDPEPARAVPVVAAASQEVQPLAPGVLPSSVYMLVDKTVELQAKPLKEFAELGSLPEEELDLQALMLFTNPRQAKRQCGRTQRVIKVPDAEVLQRRSSYLVAQGITRLVVEGGSLFAIAGS
jgi:hypothetical protein